MPRGIPNSTLVKDEVVQMETKSPETQSQTLQNGPIEASDELCVVTRSFQGTRRYEPGEAFEMEHGRRRDLLVRDRRIRDLERGEDIYRCACGRLWSGEERARSHCS
jgi:hypothetical protein